MLIDNEKFIGLLVENSGIEKEKVEKYVEELVSDIKTAFDEGEGYELEGFGFFSKLGTNILFIPSDELETEINYKYVGMEPIKLPSGASDELGSEEGDDEIEENPIQGILDGGLTGEVEEYEDPFAELFSETEHEGEESEDDEDIEAAVEEEIEQEDLEEIFKDTPDDQEETIEELSDEELIEGSNDGNAEKEDAEEASEEVPGPDEWGINAHKEEDQEDAFSGLLGEAAAESELIDEDDIFASDVEQEEKEEPADEEIDFSALEDSILEDEDFDDPFGELEDDKEQEEDFVPIVTNVSSEKTSEESVTDNGIDDTGKESNKKSKYPKSPRDKKKSAPVFLYMILVLVALAGTGYLAAYFGVVNIEGITPEKNNAQVAQVKPPESQPQNELPQTVLPEAEESTNAMPEPATTVDGSSTIGNGNENVSSTTNEATENTVEQPNQPVVKQNERGITHAAVDEKTTSNDGIITPVNIQADAEPYGLKGTATETGNNGYTIVLYTLSRKAGADTQFEILSKAGYRVITKEMPSQTYGALYRVSIGQFKSLADAAIAAEKVDPDILGNYIITKI